MAHTVGYRGRDGQDLVMPCCIQHRRLQGWRMPATTVYVGRLSRWDNRFEVGKDRTATECVRLFEVDHALDVGDRAAVRRDLAERTLVPTGCALLCE